MSESSQNAGKTEEQEFILSIELSLKSFEHFVVCILSPSPSNLLSNNLPFESYQLSRLLLESHLHSKMTS